MTLRDFVLSHFPIAERKHKNQHEIQCNVIVNKRDKNSAVFSTKRYPFDSIDEITGYIENKYLDMKISKWFLERNPLKYVIIIDESVEDVQMYIWIDDVRPAPWTRNTDYAVCKSVDDAKRTIQRYEKLGWTISVIDIDHDAGEYAKFGGDYIKLLDWLEETGRNYPIHIHSMNPVGVQNMRAIIQRNGWLELEV